MKRHVLTICFSLISVLVIAQVNDKVIITKRIQEFKNHVYLSTSTEPMASLNLKGLKSSDLEASLLLNNKLENVRLKSGDLQGAHTDTTHTYPWNPQTQDWDTVPTMMIIKEYDDNGNLIHYVDFNWVAKTKSWLANIQYVYKYNISNQLVDAIQQSWQYDITLTYKWVNVEHCIYQYNEVGQQSGFYYQYWDLNLSKWVDVYKYDYLYDVNGNRVELAEKDWDSGNETWFDAYRSFYKFENNILTSESVQMIDYNENDWMDVAQTFYDYNNSRKKTEVLCQVWDFESSEWSNYQLKVNYYNNKGKVDSFETKYWDSFLLTWPNSEKCINKYDSKGNIIAVIGFSYNSNTKNWDNSWQYLYGYNENGIEISSSKLFWDGEKMTWASGTSTKNYTLTDVIKGDKVISTNIGIFPNPAQETVCVNAIEGIQKIDVFSSAGVPVSSNIYNGENSVRLNVSNLRSGIYIIIISSGSGKVIRKLVKE